MPITKRSEVTQTIDPQGRISVLTVTSNVPAHSTCRHGQAWAYTRVSEESLMTGRPLSPVKRTCDH